MSDIQTYLKSELCFQTQAVLISEISQKCLKSKQSVQISDELKKNWSWNFLFGNQKVVECLVIILTKISETCYNWFSTRFAFWNYVVFPIVYDSPIFFAASEGIFHHLYISSVKFVFFLIIFILAITNQTPYEF